MILVTGAAGKTGTAVVRALVARGARVQALVHRPENAAAVKGLGTAEVVVGSFEDFGVLASAAARARAIFHIGLAGINPSSGVTPSVENPRFFRPFHARPYQPVTPTYGYKCEHDVSS